MTVRFSSPDTSQALNTDLSDPSLVSAFHHLAFHLANTHPGTFSIAISDVLLELNDDDVSSHVLTQILRRVPNSSAFGLLSTEATVNFVMNLISHNQISESVLSGLAEFMNLDEYLGDWDSNDLLDHTLEKVGISSVLDQIYNQDALALRLWIQENLYDEDLTKIITEEIFRNQIDSRMGTLGLAGFMAEYLDYEMPEDTPKPRVRIHVDGSVSISEINIPASHVITDQQNVA